MSKVIAFERSNKSIVLPRRSGFFMWVVLAISFAFMPAVAQDTPIIYLEWVDDPTSTMVINWIAPENSNRTLSYRPTGGNWSSVNGAPNTIPGSDLRRFKVDLDDLQDNTVFQFRVPGDSDTYTFKTAPATAEEPVKFIVGSDVYTDSIDPVMKDETRQAFTRVGKLAAEQDPLFVALGGDLAHAGSDPGSAYLWFEFLELWQETMVTESGRVIPIIITLGNNEVEGSFGASPEDMIFINTLFNFPKEQWSANSFNHYGVLDFGSYLSLFMLNTNHSNSIEGAQTNWLTNQLNNRRSVDHIFPVYHVAGWPVHRSFRGIHEDAVRNSWHNLFLENGIRYAFEHHDHIFKKTKGIGPCELPIDHSDRSCELSETGVIYIGGGSWGSPNAREFQKDWHHEIAERVHNVIVIEVTDSYRKVVAINEHGDVVTEEIEYIRLSPPDEFIISELETDGFVLDWNSVPGVDRYYLEVSYDEQFDRFVSGYKDRNFRSDGNHSVRLEDLRPNQYYYARLRSQNLFTESNRSETIKIVLPPESPSIRASSNISVTEFTANWESLELGDPGSDYQPEYLLDVSYNEDFTNILPDYNGLNMGNDNSYVVTGMDPGTTYYYRVKAVVEDQESGYSDAESLRTVGIDLVETTVETDVTRILANSEQVATMDIKVIGENGQPVAGVPITFDHSIEGVVQLESLAERTDGNGEIRYLISGTEEGSVTLGVSVSTTKIGEPVTIEVQPFTDRVRIGNNFPNPFNLQTFIPVTIPENNTEIHLSIVNVLGAHIQTIVDREVMQAGYYELPFIPSGGLASGIYFTRLITSDGVEINKMTYTK